MEQCSSVKHILHVAVAECYPVNQRYGCSLTSKTPLPSAPRLHQPSEFPHRHRHRALFLVAPLSCAVNSTPSVCTPGAVVGGAGAAAASVRAGVSLSIRAAGGGGACGSVSAGLYVATLLAEMWRTPTSDVWSIRCSESRRVLMKGVRVSELYHEPAYSALCYRMFSYLQLVSQVGGAGRPFGGTKRLPAADREQSNRYQRLMARPTTSSDSASACGYHARACTHVSPV